MRISRWVPKTIGFPSLRLAHEADLDTSQFPEIGNEGLIWCDRCDASAGSGAHHLARLNAIAEREIADLQHATWSIRRITGGGRWLPGPNGEGCPPRPRGVMVENGGKPGKIAGRKP